MRVKAVLSHSQVPTEARVSRLHIEEGLSRLFVADVECVCADPDLELASMLGTEGVIVVAADDASSLTIHGFIEEAEYIERRGFAEDCN